MSTYIIPHTPRKKAAITCGEILPFILALILGFAGIEIAKGLIEENLDRQAQAQEATR